MIKILNMLMSKWYVTSEKILYAGITKYNITVVLILYLIVASLNWNTYASNLRTEPNGIHRSSKVLRLAIADFEKIGGLSKYGVLKRSLSEAVAVGLVENEGIQYVDRGKFWTVAMEMDTPINLLRKNPDMLYAEEILDELNIHLLLKGSFTIYRGRIHFEVKLVDRRKNGKPVYVSTIPRDIEAIFSGIDMLTKEINAEIVALEKKDSGINLALLSFKDKSSKPSSNIQYGKDIIFTLVPYLSKKENINVISWSKTKNYSNKEMRDEKQILKELREKETKANVLLKGYYSIDGNRIIISPLLYIKETETLFEMESKESNTNNYFNLISDLAEEIEGLLGAISWVESGKRKWNTERLLVTKDSAEEYIKEGKKYSGKDGNYYLAASMFNKAIDESPDCDEAFSLLGNVRAKQGLYQEALQAFNSAININAKDAETYKGLGDVYLELGDYRKALRNYKTASEIDQNLDNINLNLGEVYYLLNMKKASISAFEKALEYNPENFEAYEWLGRISLSKGKGRTEAAENIYKKALKIDPNNIVIKKNLFNIYYNKGKDMVNAGKYKTALNYFNKARDTDPNPLIYRWLMFVLNKLGLYDEAIVKFDEAMKLNVDKVDKELYNNYGYALYRSGEYDKALEAYNKATNIDIKYVDAYIGKGAIFDKQKKYEKALTAYDEAIIIYPGNAKFYNARGHSLTRLERYDEAVIAFERAIVINPVFVEAYIGKAEAKFRLKRYAEAAAAYNKALRIDPKNANSYYNLARIYSQKGISGTALINFKKAIDIDKTFLQKANYEKDFAPIKDDPEFIKLIEVK